MTKNYIEYFYLVLIITIIVILIVFFIKLKQLMKSIVITNNKIDNVKNELNLVKDKTQEIKKSEDSYKFFIEIYVVLNIVKEVITAYKKETRKEFRKTFAKVCLRNATKIKKFK